jgi:hypothetical protein
MDNPVPKFVGLLKTFVVQGPQGLGDFGPCKFTGEQFWNTHKINEKKELMFPTTTKTLAIDINLGACCSDVIAAQLDTTYIINHSRKLIFGNSIAALISWWSFGWF